MQKFEVHCLILNSDPDKKSTESKKFDPYGIFGAKRVEQCWGQRGSFAKFRRVRFFSPSGNFEILQGQNNRFC